MKKNNLIKLVGGFSIMVIAPYAVAKTNALHYAVSVEDPVYIKNLIENHDVSVIEKNNSGNSPVHIASIKNKVLAYMSMSPYIEDVNYINSYKQTPIVLASKNNSLEVAYALMLKGANPNIKDAYNMNAFDYAKKLDSPLMYEILSTFSLKENIKKLEARIEFLKNKLNEGNKDNKAIQTEIDFFEKVLKEKDGKIEVLTEKNKEKDKKIKEIMELYNKQKAELDVLKAEVSGVFGDRVDRGNKQENKDLDIKDKVIKMEEDLKSLRDDKKASKNIGTIEDATDNIKDIPIQSERYIGFNRDSLEIEILESLNLDVRKAEGYLPSIAENAFNLVSGSFSKTSESEAKLFLSNLLAEMSSPIIIIKEK